MLIELCRPSNDRVDSYLAMVAEMRALGEKIWDSLACLPGETPADFVQRVLRGEHSPAAGRVPDTVHWAVLEGEVVGRIALRHFLDDNTTGSISRRRAREARPERPARDDERFAPGVRRARPGVRRVTLGRVPLRDAWGGARAV